MKDSLIQVWQSHSETIIALDYNLILAIIILVTSSLIARKVLKTIQNAGLIILFPQRTLHVVSEQRLPTEKDES